MTHSRPFARKRFGQHYLLDRFVLDTIIRHAEISPADHIIEIGPGRGALTDLIIGSCDHLTVVEIDRDLARDLEKKHHGRSEITILTQDILQTDWTQLIRKDRSNKIIANLPYNISTPLFFRFVEHRRLFTSMVIMVQKEVALRLIADGTAKKLKDYGILSVVAGLTFDIEWICDVPAEAFNPPPKVESAVIKLIPKTDAIPDEVQFFQFIRQAFHLRRKRLLTSLKNNTPAIYQKIGEETLATMQDFRPEDLRPAQYLSLFQKGSI